MKRPWQVWGLFAVCLLLVLIAMAWLSDRALRLDRDEALAREELQQELNAKLAVWRLDAALTPLLAQEAFWQSDRDDNSPDTGQRAARAPQGLPPYVLLRFRSVGGDWTSPQVPEALSSDDSVQTKTGMVAQRLEQLQNSVEVNRLAALLPEVRVNLAEAVAMRETYRLDEVPQVTQNSLYGSQFDGQFEGERSRPQTSKSDPDRNRRDLEQLNVEGSQELVARNQAVQAYTSSRLASPWSEDAAEANLLVGDRRVLWLDNRLLYVGRISVDGRVGIQGSWLDWPEIKQQLLAQWGDLIPDADLVPLNDDASEVAFAPGRALAALPVQLVLPPVTLGAMPWTPIRISLVVVWSCLVVAAIATAGLLWGILRLSERRAAFVAAVTHELRTPLTTFKMYSEMLANGMVSDEATRRNYLATLLSESDRLIQLVENVLSYARIERGRRLGSKMQTTVGELLSRCEARLMGRVEAAAMQLQVCADVEQRTTSLMTDSAAVEQILFNLVDNACKYGQGGVDDRILMAVEVTPRVVRFRVKDHGPGISPAARKNLFRPFSKSVEDAAATAPGVGLGLALSHRLARDLDGDLRCEDAEVGAAFVLELPRVGRADAAESTTQHDGSAAASPLRNS